MTKEKLNLSIEQDLKKTIKHIAITEDKTVSELVEIYIKAISSNREIIKLLEQMGTKKKK
ncbi:MAG: hypothetical protein IJ086_14185 [Clostridium sp.]|nr:hypothetical protein [Clostridium sp.]